MDREGGIPTLPKVDTPPSPGQTENRTSRLVLRTRSVIRTLTVAFTGDDNAFVIVGMNTLTNSVILHFSGKFQPGMNAILGPTGSGKST